MSGSVFTAGVEAEESSCAASIRDAMEPSALLAEEIYSFTSFCGAFSSDSLLAIVVTQRRCGETEARTYGGYRLTD